jgi:hypothetical protein
MLSSADELRHEPTDRPNWRESVYFAFADPQQRLGAWIYMWVLPNLGKSGVVVSFYHGVTRAFDTMAAAFTSPGHLLLGDGEEWAYVYHEAIPGVLQADFDDANLCGLRLRRIGPLEGYEIEYDDGEGTTAELTYRFTTQPYDYGSGQCPSPPWLADNRYHRSGRVSGEVNVQGRRLEIEATGDADHSWGTRDNVEMGKGDFTLWAFSDAEDRVHASAIAMYQPNDKRRLGFIQIDGEMQSIADIKDSVSFDETAFHRDVELELCDVAGRSLRATMREPFAAIRLATHRPGWGWGYEAMGTYEVEGYGPCPGTVAYYWPGHVTAEQLAADGRIGR